MMIAQLQPKGASKLSGNSSGKLSTHSKIPASSNCNEYLSLQQTKNMYQGGSHYATNRSSHGKKEEYKSENGPGSQSLRTVKDSKVILASSSTAQLAATKKHSGSSSILYQRSK